MLLPVNVHSTYVIVSVRVNFFVFGGSDKDDIVRICCNGVFRFCVRV